MMWRCVAVALFIGCVGVGVPEVGAQRLARTDTIGISGRNVVVRVEVSAEGCDCGLRVGLWGRGITPARGVCDIGVTVDGREVMLPVSAFADLSDVRSISVRGSKRDVVVEMEGGETGEGYSVLYTISARRSRLVRRRVWSRELPEAGQVTVYSYSEGR